jgi:hypothetical protein
LSAMVELSTVKPASVAIPPPKRCINPMLHGVSAPHRHRRVVAKRAGLRAWLFGPGRPPPSW